MICYFVASMNTFFASSVHEIYVRFPCSTCLREHDSVSQDVLVMDGVVGVDLRADAAIPRRAFIARWEEALHDPSANTIPVAINHLVLRQS